MQNVESISRENLIPFVSSCKTVSNREDIKYVRRRKRGISETGSITGSRIFARMHDLATTSSINSCNRKGLARLGTVKYESRGTVENGDR